MQARGCLQGIKLKHEPEQHPGNAAPGTTLSEKEKCSANCHDMLQEHILFPGLFG